MDDDDIEGALKAHREVILLLADRVDERLPGLWDDLMTALARERDTEASADDMLPPSLSEYARRKERDAFLS